MKDKTGFLTDDEVARLLNYAKNLRNHLILRILWVTGCRVSELLLLMLRHINFEEGAMVLRTLKRRKEVWRRVDLDDRTLQLVREYVEEYRIRGRLFKITRQRVFQIVRETGRRAGIIRVGTKKLHPHHLRHSHSIAFIRRMDELGTRPMESLRQLQRRLDHANIQTTAHYLQFASRDSKKMVEETFGRW